MASTLHATLGASSAHRWIPCPGSIRMSKDMPNESSVYAREGSAAHEIGEMALREGKNAIDFLGFKLEEYPEVEVDETMCALVQEYLDAVRGEIEKYEEAGFDDAELGVEIRFDLSHIYPQMFGTCDAVLYLPRWKKLIVFDYKHGWLSVPVERNPQTMYYALGAITGKHNREVDDVELVIVQPRSGHRAIVKRWPCTIDELMDYKYVLIDSAKRTERADSKLNPGEWCKFCPASPVCRALTNRVVELIKAKPDPVEGLIMPEPDKIPFDDLKEVWLNAAMIESWVKNVKSYCHNQAINGNKLPGTKLVEGRSNRKWKDEKAAALTLNAMEVVGEIEGSVYIKKLKSPAQIEDMLPKKERKVIEDLWVKGQGALTLVLESDEREPARRDGAAVFAED